MTEMESSMTVISLAERMQEPPDSADHIRLRWASRISARWQDSVDAILDVGRLLIEAKGELPHGQWLKMFDGREVPFGKRTAQMLIKVSLDARLTNTKHASLLPNSWFTLYELTRYLSGFPGARPLDRPDAKSRRTPSPPIDPPGCDERAVMSDSPSDARVALRQSAGHPLRR